MSTKKQNDPLNFAFYAGYLAAKRGAINAAVRNVEGLKAVVNDAVVQDALVQDTLVRGAIVSDAIANSGMVHSASFNETLANEYSTVNSPTGFDPSSLQTAEIDSSFILKQIVDSSPDLIFSVNLDYELLSVNKSCTEAFRDSFGIDAEIGRSLLDLLNSNEKDREQFHKILARAFVEESLTVNIPLSQKEVGAPVYEVQASAMKNAADRVIGAFCVFRNVNARLLERDRLEFLASHDSVTRVKNRAAFLSDLDSKIYSIRQSAPTCFCLFLGIEELTTVKEECGYLAYDRCLLKLGLKLKKSLVQSDSLARVGDHEFAVLVDDHRVEQAKEVAVRLSKAIENFHFIWKKRTYHLKVSIGISEVNGKTIDAQEGIEKADLACYAARKLEDSNVYVNALK